MEDWMSAEDWRDPILVCNEVSGVPDYAGSVAPFGVDDIAEVLLASANYGDYAETDVVGLLRLKDGRFAFVSAGCDTTGWDCQAGGRIKIADSIEALSRLGMSDEDRERLWPAAA